MKRKIVYGNGRHLSYAEYGDRNGFPILVQHGLIASIDDHNLFDRLIRSQARLICVARPGYGESSPYELDSYAAWADITGRLVEELSLTQCDLLGISSGAPYAYAIACRFPERVRNVYILSGTPALYDETVLSAWPYPPLRNKSIAELEVLSYDLFFANLTAKDLKNNDLRDSTMNHAFGVAQDLRLRFMDWGFSLSDVRGRIFMRHSKEDQSVPYETAIRTAELLSDCELELTETGPHFSPQTLDEFLERTVIKNLGAFESR